MRRTRAITLLRGSCSVMRRRRAERRFENQRSRHGRNPSKVRGRAAPPDRRPLLVIDGDSFAHRSYHALPKTILRRGRKPAGAILGFANMLLRLYREEQPRAILVGWDTLEVPTYRHEKFPAYQSGREFDDALVEQLELIPEFVAACGFQNAKSPGYEADDFLATAAAAEEKRGGTVFIASGDRDTFQLASDRTTILYPVRAGEMARIDPSEVRARYGVDPTQVPDFIALRGDPSDKLPGAPGVGASAPQRCCKNTVPLKLHSTPVVFPYRRKACGFTGQSRLWTGRHLCRPPQPKTDLAQGG